jgi:cytochrome P450 PksS
MNALLKPADATMLNFMDPAYLADPYPSLAALREGVSIAKGKQVPPYGDAWTITRYADVVSVLKDSRFSVEPRRLAGGRNPLERWWLPRTFRLISEGMLNKDDPDHYRLRNLVHRAFTPRFIEALQTEIEQITDELLADCAGRDSVDLMQVFAMPLPLAVISHMLGVPKQDRFKFRQLTNRMMGTAPTGILSALRGVHSMHRLLGFLDSLLKLRRREPDSGLITALVAAEQAGDRLSSDELLAMLFLLLFAGHETTVNLIGSGMLALLDNPEQLELLKQQPALADSAVEELLRYTNPVQFGASRIALEDVELGGVRIAKSSVVVAMLASANRDASVFNDPEKLDITRDPNRHLAFGLGIHFCLGAPLARMEGHIAFNKLLERFPRIRLAVPRDRISWRASPVFRGLQSLPVRLE